MRLRMKSWRRRSCWRTFSLTTPRLVRHRLCDYHPGLVSNVTSLFFFHSSALKLDELNAALKKKDDDMRAMEERYKMYLEKARDVSHGLVLAFGIIFWEHYRPLTPSCFLAVGDPCSRSQVKPSHSWDPVSEEPAIRSGQADRQPGGEAAVVTPPHSRVLLSALRSWVTRVVFLCSVSVSRPGWGRTKRSWLSPRGTTRYYCFFFDIFQILTTAAKLTKHFRSWSSERELPEAGDGVSPQRPQRLPLHVPDALLPVPAASSVQRAAPCALHQRACHYLQVDFGVIHDKRDRGGARESRPLALSHQSALKWP